MHFPKFLKIAVNALKQEVRLRGNKTTVQSIPHPRDVKMVETIAAALGFSYEMLPPSNGGYGRFLEHNNSWTGMLGQLQDSKADMIISSLAMTEERDKVFLYSYPTRVTEITFCSRKHEYLPNMYLFLHPFSSQVWFALAVCLCVMPFVFKFLLRKKNSLQVLALSTILYLTGQSGDLLPTTFHEHLLLLLWFWGSMFVSYTYSAVLLSFITFPTLDGIRTISDLAYGIREGRYESASYPGSYFAPVLIHSNNSLLETIGNSLMQTEGSTDFLPILGNYTNPRKPSFITGRETFMPYKDFFFISDENFFFALSAIAMRREFCCKPVLDRVVQTLYENGVMEKIYSDFYHKLFLQYLWRIPRGSEDDAFEGKLTLTVFKGPFIFVVLCHVFATIVFFVEIYLGKRRVKRQGKQSEKESK